ncbi:GAF domain-containing protein, partial [Sphingomonas sp. Leaf10]|uniref:GAF domain-containing protein n=1 Tax=Sphingomonas sp. Leaf10 TaxID=1735676 RepID=UPI00138F2550
SLLSILYGDTQYVIAAHRFSVGAYSRKNSLSGHALAAGNELFVIPDLSSDERFAENPWINGENARFKFYAASLVRPYGRLPVGVLSVLDDKVRPTISELERNVIMNAANEAAERIVQISQDRNMSPVAPSPPHI